MNGAYDALQLSKEIMLAEALIISVIERQDGQPLSESNLRRLKRAVNCIHKDAGSELPYPEAEV